MTSLSVVMPVYNELAGIDEVVAEIVRNVLAGVVDSELVIVDDRSSDGTSARLDDLAKCDPRIRVLHNEVNVGHGRSVRRAIDSSSGDWIFQLDSDGQVDVAEFTLLWARRTDSDLITGRRVNRHDPRHRLVLTAVTRAFVSSLARRRVPDANAPFKLYRRTLFEHLAPSIPSTAFAPSILIVLGALRSGARVTEIDISHRERQHGRSTLRLGRLGKAVTRSAVETLNFARQQAKPYVHR